MKAASMLAALAVLALATIANAAPQSFADQVLGDAPILYYRLNESTGNALNLGSLGSPHDGFYNGTITRNVPTLGGDTGVGFDGVDDFIEAFESAPIGLTGNPTFTAETVVLVTSATLWAPFLHWGSSEPGDPTGRSVYFSLSNASPDEVFVGFYNGGLQSPSGGPFTPGVWHHVVWVRQGGGTDQEGSTLYIDGVDVTSLLAPDPDLCCNGGTPNVNATQFRINRARDLTRFFVGSMDEIALYDRALTPAEVTDHYLAFVNPVPVGGPLAWVLLSGLLLATGVALLRRSS